LTSHALTRRVRREHHLKTWPEIWNAIASGVKTAEYRIDDRHFAVGDVLCFKWWDPSQDLSWGKQEHPLGYAYKNSGFGSNLSYDDKVGTESIRCRVTHIVRGPHFGIPEGYCVMSMQLLPTITGEENHEETSSTEPSEGDHDSP